MADGQQNYFDPLVLARLSNLYLRARWVVEGVISGIHRSRARGFSVEFEEHREYSPGDELRRVDWKGVRSIDGAPEASQLESRTPSRTCCCTSSASMDYASNGITKFAYGCTLTASLAYLILKQQDAAGLVTFSNRVESFVPPKAKRGYLMEMLRALEASRPSGETKVGKILYEIAGQMKRRGLVVLVSDLLDDPEEILRGLRLFRLKGNDVIVFHLLDPAELDLPFDGNILFEDLEQAGLEVTADPRAIRGIYRKVVEEFTQHLRSECHGDSIDYQLLTTSTPLDHALVSYLSWRG